MQLSGYVITTPHAFVYCNGCVTGHNTGRKASAGQEVNGIFDSASSTLASMLEIGSTKKSRTQRTLYTR